MRPAFDQRPARARLGFLGVGWIGRHRLEAIVRSGVASVAAISDPLAQAAEQAAALAPGCARLQGLDEILDAGVDGVVIATPSALHAAQVQRALERGVAVFCQKPLGRDAAEVKGLVEAARAQDVLLGVDLSYRFVAGVEAMKRLVQQGELGEVYGLDLAFHNAYGPDKPWFYDPALAGGGCVIDLGIHLVDLALWTLGYPEVSKVDAQLLAGGEPLVDPSRGVEDYASVQAVLGGKAAMRLTCSWKLQAGCDCFIEAAFYGTRGGVALRNVGGSFYDFTVERFRGTSRERLGAPPDAWGGRAAVAWASRLAAGSGFDPEAEHLVEVAALLDRIYGRGR